MNNLRKKRLVSALLAFALLLCVSLPVNADAVTNVPVNPSTKLSDGDLLIPEPVAEYVADYFVDSMIEMGTTIWDDNTTIVDSVTTFNETGDTITSYTFELTDGYVTVAAYVDMPSPILEWADQAEPAYSDFELTDGSKVIYTGPMSYYLDDGDSTTLETIDGTTVDKSQITDCVSPLRNRNNLRPQLANYIASEKAAALKKKAQTASVLSAGGYSTNASDNTWGGYITSVTQYAYNVFGGTWTCTDWSNKWENYAHFALMSSFYGYKKHCGPTAITNAIQMYRKKHNISTGYDLTVFKNVIKVNDDNNKKYYGGPYHGTWNSTAGEFIKKSFAECGIDVDIYGQYDCTVENMKNATTSNRLMYIMLLNHINYGDHHVIGYAWTEMTCKEDPYDPFYFIKISDGHRSSGTYLHQSYIEGWGTKYWEIYCG